MAKAIQTKLLNVQAELRAPKSQYNSFGKYAYRTAEDILEAAKPLLLKHGLTLTISDEPVVVGERFYIKATATILCEDDSISVNAYAREENEKKGMDAAQLTGATSTYARKYALCGLFCIDDNKDADTASAATTATKEDAIKELGKATSQDALVEVWNKYANTYGNDNDFRVAYMKQQRTIANGTRK